MTVQNHFVYSNDMGCRTEMNHIIWCVWLTAVSHDDVIKWKHFPRNWPFVRGIQRSPVNSPHKGQWRGALMFSLIYARINDWLNTGEASDLRRRHAHYDSYTPSPVFFFNPTCIILPNNALHLNFVYEFTRMFYITGTMRERHGVSNHRPHDCLFKGLFR